MKFITKLSWYGATYSDDSVFYADSKTEAVKNLTEYNLKETDPAGNVTMVHWQALSYEGKLLRAFSQTTENNIQGKSSFTRSNITYLDNNPAHVSSYHEKGVGTDNLEYEDNRSGILYNNRDQITAYHDELTTTQIDGKKTKTTVDAKFTYQDIGNQYGKDVDPENRLLESVITAKTENADGSIKTETATTTYQYDANNQLIGAKGYSEFNGQDPQWFEYKDVAGHLLTKKSDGTYTYVDSNQKTVTVPAEQVTITQKDGNKFSGTSETQFEILGGEPATKEVHSTTAYYNAEDNSLLNITDSTISYNNGLVNNLQRVLDTQGHTEVTYPSRLDPEKHIETQDIATVYQYDEKGHLIDVQGAGQGSGWEYSSDKGWFGQYTSVIAVDYDVILGQAVITGYTENKTYKY